MTYMYMHVLMYIPDKQIRRGQGKEEKGHLRDAEKQRKEGKLHKAVL